MDDPENESQHKFRIPGHRPHQPGLEVDHARNAPAGLEVDKSQHDARLPEVFLGAPASPHPLSSSATSPFVDSSADARLLHHQRSFGGGAESARGNGVVGESSSSLPPPPQSSESTAALHRRSPGSYLAGTRLEPMKIREQEHYEDEGMPRRRPPPETVLGLKVLQFWAMISLLVFLLAAGLGVGLGVGLSRSNAAATKTFTTLPTAVQILNEASAAPLNPYCPGRNATEITPLDASGEPIRLNNEEVLTFRMLCNTFWPQRQGINPRVRDIMLMTVPDMLTCLTLCAEFNQEYSNSVGDDVGVGGGMCVGVGLIKGEAQFCYLKNATGVNDTSKAFGFPADSAVLVGNWSRLTGDQQLLAFGGTPPGRTGNSTRRA